MVHTLTAGEARDLAKKKCNENHETYKLVWKQLMKRVKERAEVAKTKGEMMLEWCVPAFLFDRPYFKVARATRYVTDKMRHYGYEVREIAPNTLLVDWSGEKKKGEGERVPPEGVTSSLPSSAVVVTHGKRSSGSSSKPNKAKVQSKASRAGADDEAARSIARLKARLNL